MEPLVASNPLQRWYLRRARTGYQRLEPDIRAQAEALDRLLLSQRGLWIWGAVVAGALAVAVWLRSEGLSTAWNVTITLLLTAGVARSMRRAWLRPEQFSGRRLVRIGFAMVAVSYVEVIATLFGVHGSHPVHWGEPGAWDTLWRVIRQSTPLQIVAGLLILAMLWTLAAARREQSQRELMRLQLIQERDAAARQASEAQLRLLRAQIQPHFIFNTLSAVQHWVDTGDERASNLLRELTAFLRGSTDLLCRPEVTLADEVALLRHYLSVMQSRLGDRLRFSIEIHPSVLAQPLPPGLLVTLAENAIEHGIAPSLQGGEIEVRAHRAAGCFVLTVRNTGELLRAGWSDGVGLANTRERLRHRFGDRALLVLVSVEQGTVAAVTVQDAPDAAEVPA